MKSNKYDAAFIVRTPYHYINALEAAYSYDIEKGRSALIIWSNHPDKKFGNFIDKKNWKTIEHIPVILRDGNDSFVTWGKERVKDLSYILRSNVTANHLGRIEMCFSVLPNNTQIQHLINKLGAKKVIILDEGVATFGFAKKYLDKKGGKMGSTIFGFDRARNQDFEFFTSFPLVKYVKDLKKEEIRRHSFEYLKSKTDFQNINQIKGLILGTQRLGDIGSIYNKFISMSLKFISHNPKKIWYKPHRWETNSEIKNIKKSYNLEVIDNTFPIEAILATSNIVPNKVAGFASTAIHSINKIFANRTGRSVVFGVIPCDKKMPYKYFEDEFGDEVEVRYIK